MQHTVRVHYDNQLDFGDPVMWVWVSDGATLEKEVHPTGSDEFGVYFDLTYNRTTFKFKFKDGTGKGVFWEDARLERYYHIQYGAELWTMADRHNIYSVRPAVPRENVKSLYEQIKHLVPEHNFYLPNTDVSGMGVPSLLGANLLKDGSLLFGFFHPRAARVYLAGSFNGFQCPGHSNPDPSKFIEMELYRGFYYQPNLWLARIHPEGDPTQVEYKFYVQGGLGGVNEKYVTDPYTRVYADDFKFRNCQVIDPTRFQWTDQQWKTPDMKDLILYEMNVYGFTDNDPDIPEPLQGTFKGVTHRIKNGYLNDLGITCIALMPTAEVPKKQGLGYEPCSFMAVEKDFGSPDDFREMINEAHNHGLAVIIDQVFNHTSNDFNPLWDLIDDGSGEGGFYFAGKTMWGNKVATGKDEVDNMLVDSCKLFIREYHVDGFRFDATHSFFLNHKLLHRIAHEIKDTGFKPDTILIAENLPNEQDLNLDGYNGFAQWSNDFHDKLKAILREGRFEGAENVPEGLGNAFYFSKKGFAAHTNNVVNYIESHDENSVQFEVSTSTAQTWDPAVKARKARLGLMATMTALGQPMIYMGQEFGVERERNRIDVAWMEHPETGPYHRWARGVINLRRRYPGLRLSGYNPIDTGEFTWMLGPWLDESQGRAKRVIGWRTYDNGQPQERTAVLFNFENHEVKVDLDLHTPGYWVKLADMDRVNDIPPVGDNRPGAGDSLCTESGWFGQFTLPPLSGFIYKYEPQPIQ
ncbi:MAG: 1,4-alpha-glucan branching protein [Firmicutes bacterium]|nr:1,4-alpha-glucan branching protein [Bacillota bacterium]